MLRQLTKGILNVVALITTFWLADRDYCLIRNAPSTTAIDLGVLLFGLGLQILPLALVIVAINRNGGYFRFVHENSSYALVKAALFVLPFMLLFIAKHPISYAIYSPGENDKIVVSQRIDAALKRCCKLCVFGLGHPRDVSD